MSKTDKTTPFRVVLVRDGIVKHNHNGGRVCDFDQFDPAHPWNTHCGYRIPNMSWHRSMKYFGRPRFAAGVENVLERQNRRAWKNALATKDFDNISIGRLDSAYFID